MQEYLNSKVTEYSLLLDWIEHEVESIQKRSENHYYPIKYLQDEIAKLNKSLSRLRVITRIESPHLIRRALPIIHELEYQVSVITHYYIPALQRENKNDLFLRSLFLSTARRCGLPWIKDILVRLDGTHAIFPVLTDIPVIFAPPQQATRLSDMAGVYHELGHNVFQRFKEIANNLAITVYQHFSELRQSIGPMSPEKRRARNRAIEDAINYWSIERLNELFCDIYASFVCGPAYYFSCVDMAMRIGSNPFRISTTDVHPPLATRVYACYRTLSPLYQEDDVIASIQNIWIAYTNIQQKESDFDFICANALINQFIDTAIRNIEQLLPEAQCYTMPLPNVRMLMEIPASESLENILNRGIKILLTQPSGYAEWEKNLFKILRE